MSLCPITDCRKVYCDHTPEERGQTREEMMAPLTSEEEAEWAGKQPEEVAALPPEVQQLLVEKE